MLSAVGYTWCMELFALGGPLVRLRDGEELPIGVATTVRGATTDLGAPFPVTLARPQAGLTVADL